MNVKTKYIECDCYSMAHTIRFMSDVENREVYTEVRLVNHDSVLKRLMTAVKYVFRKPTSQYGDYDCSLLSGKKIDDLIEFLKNHKRDVTRLHNSEQKIKRALREIKEGKNNSAYTDLSTKQVSLEDTRTKG